MKDVKALLQLLKQEFPINSVSSHRHNVTLGDNETLTVTLWLPLGDGVVAQPFTLDEADLAKTPEQIVSEIKALTPRLL